MPIRYYLLTIVMGCTCGGIALAFGLHQWFQRIDAQHDEIGTNSVVIREIEGLKGSLDGVLITADLVFGAEEAYLAERGVDQCQKALRSLKILTTAPLLEPWSGEIEKFDAGITGIATNFSKVSNTVDENSIDLVAMLTSVDDISLTLIFALEKLETNGKEAAQKANQNLQKDRELLYKVTGVGLILYLLGALILGRWAWSRIASPIQALTIAADHSMNDGVPFQQEEKGPSEAKKLTRTIGQFIGLLEERVESRTVELREAKLISDAANDAKGEFLANMSHEMRTPMNAILGFSDFLAETPLNQEQENYVKIVRSSGDALLTLINDILDFSKIEAGKLELESRAYYLRDCVEGSVELVAPTAAEKGIEISYSIQNDVPVSIVGDEARLRQIILNLLSNAVKFTEEGEILVLVESLNDAAEQSEPMLKIAVSDTGIGIPEDKQSLLFQSFQQLQASTSREFGGTGLGLAISKRMVEMMGGEMVMKSEEDIGSTFSFTIRAPRGDRPPRPFENSAISGLENGKILAISNRQLVHQTLRDECFRWGVKVTSVRSGAEAIDAIRQREKFSVILASVDIAEVNSGQLEQECIKVYGHGVPTIAMAPINYTSSPGSLPKFCSQLQTPPSASTLFDRLREAVGGVYETSKGQIESKESVVMASEIPLRILVAEDNAINTRLVKLMLKKFGYTADYAKNGREAVERCFEAKHAYDLILMDVQMPEMDGYEATKKIRNRWSGSEKDRPVIVALTANSMNRDRRRCIEVGMDDFLSKPLKVSALKAAIVKWGMRTM